MDQKSGTFALVRKGREWEQYFKVMIGLGMADMSTPMVAFGGCPSDAAVKRLKLIKEDLNQLEGCGSVN